MRSCVSEGCCSDMIGLFLIFCSLLISPGAEPDVGHCCYRRTVSGTQDGLDGEFTVVRAGAEDSRCVDGCVYKR